MLFLAMMGFFTSCFKEDEAIEPHPRGDVQTDTIAMTETYRYQLFYSLDSAAVVRTEVKTTYDLGFECSPGGWHILLNTSNFMKAADLGVVTFGAKHDTAGATLRFDRSDGNPDSTAIGNWFTINGNDTVSNNHVYAISRGLDELGNPLGLYQVIFDSLRHGTYYFRYALLSGGAILAAEAHKDPMVNYLWFSFPDHAIKNVEPPSSLYDLLFTQYTTLLYTDEGIPYPYLVTGVLSNRKGVEVAIDTLHSFSSVTRDIALGLTYSKNIDEIGYNWKYYNFSSGAYTIRPKNCYLVHTVSGFLYKLRFIGFYDKNGSKGYPVIEFQKL